MAYSVQIKASAARALERIAAPERRRIIEAIDRLVEEPHAGGVLKGEFAGLRRLRVGDHRIVYEVQRRGLTVLVVRIGYRRKIYR